MEEQSLTRWKGGAMSRRNRKRAVLVHEEAETVKGIERKARWPALSPRGIST